MPGPKTHDIFYKQLKRKISPFTLSQFPNYDKYNTFVQGHDLLIYYNFNKLGKVKLKQNIAMSVLMQENKFQEFVYTYLKCAENSGALEEEIIRLFIGAGYIMHHLLDAYIHPLIIYYTGDHTPDKNLKTWGHGCVENLIDIYMMKYLEGKNPKTYKVYEDFKIKTISSSLVETLNESIWKTYQIKQGGDMYKAALYQLKTFMKWMKYDRFGIKKQILNKIDPLVHGAASFSYHREENLVLPFLNDRRELWINPYDPANSSYASFFDLYLNALSKGAYIVDELEKLCIKGKIHKDDIYHLIPDINSVTGLSCKQDAKILIKKEWNKMPTLF